MQTFSGVLVAAAVSFLLSSLILKVDKSAEADFQDSIVMMEGFKGKESRYFADVKAEKAETKKVAPVHKIIFACDAGMGSSAMGASVLRKKVQAAGLDIEVTNTAIEKIPEDADVIVCHEGLYERAKAVAPNGNFVVITNFLAAPEYEELIQRLKDNQ